MQSCNSTYWILDFLPALYWKPVVGSLVVTVSILATFENTLILLVFYKYPILRTKSNNILISMSTADLFTGIILGPLYSSLLLGKQLVGNCVSNEARRYFATLFLGASALSVGMLSIDRSLHLRRLQNYTMVNKSLYVGLFLSWFLPLAVPLIALVDTKVYSAVLFILGVCSVVVVIVSYVVLVIALKKYRSDANERLKQIYLKREKGAGITVLIIISCYVLMLLPLLLEQLLYSVKYFENRDKSEQAKVAIVSHLLCMCNSVVNPVIYVSRIPDIRKHLIRLVSAERNIPPTERVSVSSGSTSGSTFV